LGPRGTCLANCELFGRFAGQFESQVVPLWREVYDSLVGRAQVAPGSAVLDVGTGTGEVALRAGKAAGSLGRVFAVDTEEEMLEIGRRKAKELGASNVTFERMDVQSLDLPDDTFDSVIGNYSICCVMSYDKALRECLRVLKPGGRLTFNQSGPGDPHEFKVAFDIFEKYKTTAPSKKLREFREAKAMLSAAVERYKEVSATLDLMRRLGYESAEAETTTRVITYKDAGAFIDRLTIFNWRNEAEEIPRADLSRFRSEAIRVLADRPLIRFSVSDEMVFFTGLKP